MAEDQQQSKTAQTKSAHAEREERILSFWKEKGIFEKSLNKDAPEGEFVFYEGPPTANGRPGIHHLEARAFKDAIPRYKTMRGYHVRRKGGWDTHGLPVELAVEKQLGLKSKKEIETYGIAAFNDKCKESVWKYVHEWEGFTDRMGYWVDLKDPYITYKPDYIEALWGIVKKVDEQELLYKDFRVVPWCPRDQTVLSTHELAQGYEDVKDLAVYVKFEIRNPKSETNLKSEIRNTETKAKTYLLAWTTTPWTLPGNVGLAVGENIKYYGLTFDKLDNPKELPFKIKNFSLKVGETYIASKEFWNKADIEVDSDQSYGRFQDAGASYSIRLTKSLIGLSYEPLYPFLKDNITGPEKEKLANAYKVYAADFVTTTDGTGIVHTAVMYGQDDFELGTKAGLPKFHLVNEDGTFKKGTGFLEGRFVKEKNAEGEATLDIDIIKDLANRPTGNLLFAKEKYQHSYPHCWRCHTPLIYYARDSWYIRMSALRDKLVSENEGINWEPEHIREGRFGEWLREVKDWAISRERYWGTPLPVWSCDKCHARKVVGSVADVSKKPRNTYYVMRHGEAENNVQGILNSDVTKEFHLTKKGIEDATKTADSLKDKGFDLIVASPFFRTKETAEIVRKQIGLKGSDVSIDTRLSELGFGSWEGKSVESFVKEFPQGKLSNRFSPNSDGVETYVALKKRVGDLLYSLEEKYEGKTILIVSHGSPTMMLIAAAQGLDRQRSSECEETRYIHKAEALKLDFMVMPHNAEYELDLHRPFIDEVRLPCSCGGEMARVKEVMDVWFDSGAMPFAQDHKIGNRVQGMGSREGSRENGKVASDKLQVASEKKQGFLSNLFHAKHKLAYPADFISEAIDQTRGWFYTLHAIGILMGKGKAYKDVICLGHLLDAEGKKMSKHIGNVVNPWEMMDKYGADALRFWMYSVNQPGDSKNFDEKTVDEVVKKVFNLTLNVLSFYETYAEKNQESDKSEIRILKSDLLRQRVSMASPLRQSDSVARTNSKSKIRNSKPNSQNVLDKWIVARLDQLIGIVTEGLDSYRFMEPTRAIRDFTADLSQWYLRRSRDRFKGDDQNDKQAALATTRFVLTEFSKVLAPFTPFLAEEIYGRVGGGLESVHLEEWPSTGKIDQQLLKDMEIVRNLSSKGLEARMSAKINVRQPLARLTVKTGKDSNKAASKLSDDLIALIKDEVNVKEVVFNDSIATDVELDTTITPDLKEEGELRELLRKIQDARKERGLSVGDVATLVVTDDLKQLVRKYEAQIKKATGLVGIEYGEKFGIK